jgi:hypothetical protein
VQSKDSFLLPTTHDSSVLKISLLSGNVHTHTKISKMTPNKTVLTNSARKECIGNEQIHIYIQQAMFKCNLDNILDGWFSKPFNEQKS